VHKLVGASLVVFVRMLSVLSLTEGEVALSGRFEEAHFVDFILGKESTVVLTDVCVSSCTV
jgi:uncharacterized Fe-S center protein